LLDGTWSNSAALYRRLKVQFNAFLIWHMHSIIRLSRLSVNTKVHFFFLRAGVSNMSITQTGFVQYLSKTPRYL
jgi:hypothetical protein